MPFVIGEVEVTNEVTLAPSAVLYDGAVVADGDLTIKVNNFYYDLAGTHGKYVGSVNNAVTDNATNYVYLDSMATLTVTTAGYPPTAAHIRLARVIASGGFIVRVILERALMTAAAGGVAVAHLIKAINWVDIAGGSVVVGIVPVGSVIADVVLSVDTAFNGGTQIEVGSDLAHAEIMLATDNDPSVTGKYHVDSTLFCAAQKEVKAFFPSGTPSQGAAVLTVFVS